MSAEIFGLLVVAAAFIAYADWRRGFLFLLLIGTLQDPVRKLIPGSPPILAIAALPVWLGIGLRVVGTDRGLWSRFERAYPQAARAMRLLVLCLIPPILLVLGYGLGAWRMALLGTFAYLAPLAMLVIGFSYARTPSDVRKALQVYGAYTALFLVGAFAEYSGVQATVIGTEALGFRWLRTRTGLEAITLITGFYRSPDIMAWHAATLAMVGLSLAHSARRPVERLWLVVSAWGLLALLLAGRRKAIVMPLIWLAFLILAQVKRGRLGRAIAVVLVAGGAVAGVYFASGEIAIDQNYYQYAASAALDAGDRFQGGTIGAVQQTLIQSGVLGRGIGSATQGAQHLVDAPEQGWQESGPSKLLAELGVPGLVCVSWLAFLLGRACLRLALSVPAQADAQMVVALVGMLGANAVSFTVSHQIYSDLVVTTSTALMMGCVLSAPRWLARSGTPADRRH